MLKPSLCLSTASLAAAIGLTACPPSHAADLAFAMAGETATAPRLAGTARPDLAVALRSAWLAQGHSVQELATTSAPTITGGSVTASTITVGNAGEYPALAVDYKTDRTGADYISVEFASPNGKTFYGGGYGIAYHTVTGTVSFAIVAPVNLYASPGTWSLAGATIYDNAGNSTTYTASQLAALFTATNFTVVNSGAAAPAPPAIVSGKLLNNTVSVSAKFPLLAATITAKDGYGPGIYEAYLIVSPPGGAYSFYSVLPNARPVRSGVIKANNLFGPYSQTGTWSIVGYGVCDYAFNCSGSTADSDIVALLGTDTFTVTP
jgi:hypothetical protein